MSNVCNSSPCQHGGTCHVSTLSSYTCTCPRGWQGRHCTERDNCATNPCRNGANCTSLPDRPYAYICTCREGYMGPDCNINVNECNELNGKPNPCHHGKCFDTYGGYKCNCDDGWTGKHCSELYIPCHPSPCQNGGRCAQIGAYGYQCQCPSGFEGRDCQVNRDDCRGHLCQHGGKCLDFLICSSFLISSMLFVFYAGLIISGGSTPLTSIEKFPADANCTIPPFPQPG